MPESLQQDMMMEGGWCVSAWCPRGSTLTDLQNKTQTRHGKTRHKLEFYYVYR